MLVLVFVLNFVWLNNGHGLVTEKTTYDTMAACEAAKDKKIKDKIYANRPGDLVFSHTTHADCSEQ